MEQAMREEFEAWVSGRKVCTRYGAKLNTNPDGMYSDYRINDRWLAWKASRAALRVELPEVGSAPDGAKYDLGFGDPKFAHDYREHQVSAAMRQLCREALQQAGIEVK
ncbi:hypothetical protein [Pseudomonas aeruginosa]|uniref:hypothetical protein n=1 Tax=Pseudomonas aeruginosa TaxID=287 RepID=UPI000F82D04F|nr:hypothetical protein [Pseudomonas aeruginosa]RTW54542.1 hypothetical protein DZA06_10560 [Pseudomonas aeruginosa]